MTMDDVTHTAAIVAVLGTAVVYGTDVFCALVLRPALAAISDDAVVAVMGSVHRLGDRRMPVPGVVGVGGATASMLLALVTSHWAQAVAAGTATGALVIWLVLYTRVSAPINRQLTAAADIGRTPSNARAMQMKWDSIIGARAALQGLAVAALCVALVV